MLLLYVFICPCTYAYQIHLAGWSPSENKVCLTPISTATAGPSTKEMFNNCSFIACYETRE